MASPGEFVRRLAEVLGVPERTVTVHDRNLVTAGLRTKGGRGPSAPHMQPSDATNLVLAVAASSMVKETVATVSEYAGLPARDAILSEPGHTRGNQPTRWRLSGLSVPNLQELPERHTFRDSLTGLFSAAADGSLERAFEQDAGARLMPLSRPIEVTVFGPYPQARIRVQYSSSTDEIHYAAPIPKDITEIHEWEEKMAERYGRGDLTQIRQFTAKTFFAVGELLRT